MKGYAKQIKDALDDERRGRAPQRRLPRNHSPDSPEVQDGLVRLGSVGRTLIIQSMRVAIDARKLHDFGIGTYIRNLLRQLARIDRDTEYVLLCARAGHAASPRSSGRTSAAVLEPSPNYSLARTDPRAAGCCAREAGRLPRAALRAAAARPRAARS